MHRGASLLSSAFFIELFAGFTLLKLNAIAFTATAYLNLHVLT